MRGYYEHLALIHEHYLEVDSLLSGELPSAIVQSFAGRHRPEWPGDAEDRDEISTPGGTGWSRVTSSTDAWKVKKKRDSIENVLGSGIMDLNDRPGGEERDLEQGPEEGEGIRLLPENIEEREARRDRIARLALNGKSTSAYGHP